MSDQELTLYVRINHRQLMEVNRLKLPNLYAFCEEHIEEMMTRLTEDIAKVEKDPTHKLQIPIAYVVKEQWEELIKGMNLHKVVAMTLCFSQTKLLCDIRWDPEDMRKHQIEKMSKSKGTKADESKIIEFKPRIIMPKFPSQN